MEDDSGVHRLVPDLFMTVECGDALPFHSDLIYYAYPKGKSEESEERGNETLVISDSYLPPLY